MADTQHRDLPIVFWQSWTMLSASFSAAISRNGIRVLARSEFNSVSLILALPEL